MPVYEYQCNKCGHSFEKLAFKGDNEQVFCPKCSDNKAKIINHRAYGFRSAKNYILNL